MSATATRCFVIMPFTKTTEKHTEDYWTRHFEGFLKPLIEECPGLEAHRSEPLHGDVLRQIITDLVTVPVVVADITDRNPNVYWELGVRQSFKHGTVTIAEEGTERPFDISVKGTLYYSDDHLKDAEFRKDFKRAIMDCISNPDSSDSHVLETISGRGSLYQIIHRNEIIRRVEALIIECQRNIDILNIIYKNVEQKPEQEKEDGMYRILITRRLLSPALELLITNRYLDEPETFYKISEECFGEIVWINDQLTEWTQTTDEVDEWLLSSKKGIMDVFDKCKTAIMAVQKKLTTSC